MSTTTAPEWDLEQLEVIMDSPASWQLVIAGPGAGKSAVACQRIAFLIDQGISPSRILLISFTRTAVAELRDRIVSYAVAGEKARAARIRTLDSHAWSLRAGFEDDPLDRALDNDSYEQAIERTVGLFRRKDHELCEFMAQLEHLIVDEAQDIVGVRADLVVEILRSLSQECGVTILADPAQAIYGFTSDEGKDLFASAPLLTQLDRVDIRQLTRRQFNQVHRVKDAKLSDLFLRTRKVVEVATNSADPVGDMQRAIRENCGKDVGVSTYESIADFVKGILEEGMLVLFRWRADVLMASSYCSGAGIEHRLRMSGMPVVVKPWIGWLFGECARQILQRDQFDKLWHERSELAPGAFERQGCDDAWALLHRFAAGRQSQSLDLIELRRQLARARPPIDFCYPDLGSRGPILGTIHASKGREADTVVLVMPHSHDAPEIAPTAEDSEIHEEGRVYYVGATRARKMLVTASSRSTGVGHLDSGRTYRLLGPMRAQLEVGCDGDIDYFAHLGWTHCVEINRALASCVGRTVPIQARTFAEHKYTVRLMLELKGADAVARLLEVSQLSQSFHRDQSQLWRVIDRDGRLRPPMAIPHLHLAAVTTVALSDDQRAAVLPPYNLSGFALAPIIKGFPLLQFQYRQRRAEK